MTKAAPSTDISASLARLQDEFQRALLSGDDRILSRLGGAAATRRERLGIYRDAYTLRLVEFARNDHELLHAYLGDEEFERLVHAYAAQHPSRYRSARHFCARLPGFLGSEPPYASHPELAELAALEQALNEAFDAADAPVIAMDDLAAFPPECWGRLTFTAHPSVARMDLRGNAGAIWTALHEGREPPMAAIEDAAQCVIVWRQEIAKFRVMDEEEAVLWDASVSGLTFGALCEQVAERHGGDAAAIMAARHLCSWIASGLITSIALSP